MLVPQLPPGAFVSRVVSSLKNHSETTLGAFRETAVFIYFSTAASLAALFFRLDFRPKIQPKICLGAVLCLRCFSSALASLMLI